MNITNNCTPTCTSTIAFGTGAGASSGIDPLYGERIFTKDDSVAHDTSSVAGAQCYAYFEPIDRSVDIAYQDPNFLGTVRDIRDTLSDTTLLYKVVFKPGNVNCYPVKVCVDPNDFPAGARIVVHFVLNGSDQGIDLRNATQDGSNRCFTINDHNRNYFYIEYTPGTIGILPTVTPNVWNLISLPVIPSDPNASVVLLNAATSPFEYRAAGLWQQPANNNLQFGRGYLVKYGAYTQGSNFVAGTRSCQATNIQIDGGWNTIGGTSFTAGINQIYFTPMPNNSTPPSLLTDVWEFVATKGYRTVAFIQPGKGYFIKVDTVGYYNLNSCNSTMAKNEISNKTAIQQEVEGLKGTLSSVTVSDARSNSQELFFGNSATSLRESHFEMPPAAPELDARFTNNSGYMSYNHDSYTVALRTANYPVSLNFANVQGSVVVSDLQGNVLGTSTNGSSVAVTNPQVKQVVISYKDGGSTNAALTLGLGQNFPNPANGVTTISYTVPTKMPVSLKVYNALGQVVKTLVEGEVAAGRYDAVLDTHEMTNGTYFYTLTAGDFTQTMRMVLTK